ncbi:MAG: hypothetical protein JST82_11780 [Bacteroidetes bacterium]|nr:hypothetical protein [Bacteroidota bacterium]
MLRKVIFLPILLLCFCAQAQRYPFYNLNVENGLIQSQATSIVQDKFGHLWIGTLGGLSRYDGKNFTNYTVRNGMQNNTVTKLKTDNKGNLWIGTSKGISMYNGSAFKHYVLQSPEIPNANVITDINIANDGTVYCIAQHKAYQIRSNNSPLITLPSINDSFTSVFADGNDLWIGGTKGKIYHRHGNTWDSIAFHEPSLSGIPQVNAFYRDSRQQLWVGTDGGLYKIENNKINIAHINATPLYGIYPILSITEDKYKNIWLGTALGAFRINDTSWVYCSKKNGLTDNTIYQVITDAEGNIWMASDGKGVFRFSGARFSMLDEGTGLPSAQIMSIAATNSRVYLGTYDAGLYIFENGKTTNSKMPIRTGTTITSIKIKDGMVWLGTRGNGLWKYNGISYKGYTYPTIPSNIITCLYTDKENRLWAGCGNAVMYYSNDTFHRVKDITTAVQDFISIGNDSVLMATSEGIKLYHANEVSSYSTGTAPDSASLQCFTLKGNELWIGTSDNGVICYNLKTGKSFTINKSNGLQSDFIYNIITDNDGNIWLGTGYGIHEITMANGKPVIQFFGKEQGITGMESNHNAVFKMNDGSIWFGTTNGAVHYNPKSKVTTAKPSAIIMQSVKLFGENINDSLYFDSTDAWYNVPQKLHLPYRKNNLTFTFQAITLTGLEQIKYRYRIDGLENQWSDWSSVNSVTYSALPPGNYNLLVECKTNDSIAIKRLSYPFEIITPFHKTKWFRLLIVLACILLGVTIQYILNKRKHNRMLLLERLRREEQNKIRQRTAEDFHDEVGNKLTRINVLTNVLKNKIGPLTPDTKRIIDQIQENTGLLYGGTRDILWSLKPSNDSLYEILHRIRDFGGELYQDTEIDFIFTGTDERWHNYKMPLDMSRNLLMIFKEALNNSLKYAEATKVTIHAELKENNVLHIELKDNGKGFDPETAQRGHGIDNMNVRAKRLNARFYLDASPGNGTFISLSFKLPKQS